MDGSDESGSEPCHNLSNCAVGEASCFGCQQSAAPVKITVDTESEDEENEEEVAVEFEQKPCCLEKVAARKLQVSPSRRTVITDWIFSLKLYMF